MDMPPVDQLQARLPDVKAPARDQAEVARQFEAVFVGQMMQMMLSTVPEDGPFGGGHAESIYKGLMAEKLGEEVVRRGGLGIAPAVLGEILRIEGEKP